MATEGEDKRLDRQFEYQKFHIGVYVSLATAIVGASVFAKSEFAGLTDWRPLLPGSIVFLLLAGMCGGFVASSIPRAKTFAEFRSAKLGFCFPWELEAFEALSKASAGELRGWKRFRVRYLTASARTWESLEHFFFWIAMVQLAVFGGVAAIHDPPVNSGATATAAAAHQPSAQRSVVGPS